MCASVMQRPRTALALAYLGGALSSCASAPQPAAHYEAVVRAESDPGTPLPGVALLLGAEPLGTSGADGSVVVRASGREGERVDVEVRCPEGHRASVDRLGITLRRANDGKRPEYLVACPPLKRHLVVAVRLENGANLPVRHLGRELARTDATGAAHVLLEDAPGATVDLLLDTSERPLLRPKSPTARFRLGDSDDVVVLSQAFQSPAAPRSFAPKSKGPIRIR